MLSSFAFIKPALAEDEKIEGIFEILESGSHVIPESGCQEENMVLGRRMDSSSSAAGEPSLSFDLAAGEIRTASGDRVAIINIESLSAVCDAIHKKMGEEVRDVLYAAGLEWGTREFHKFKAEIESGKKSLYHLKNMGLNEFKTRFNALLSRFGWGTFDIEQKYDFVFVRLSNSAYAEMLSAQNPVYNDLFAGFFAGFFSELIGVDFDSVEMNIRKENFETTYLLADESVTAAVRQWISEGKKYNDIMRLLEKGEFRKKRRKAADVKESYKKAGDELE